MTTSPPVSAYHRGLVMVRLKPAANLPESLWNARLSGRAAQALGFLERAGRVRSIERLDGDENAEPSFPERDRGAAPAFFSTHLDSRAPDDPLANLVMLEVDPSQPLEPLLTEIESDPLVLRASRVPIRHLIGEASTGRTGIIELWWNLTKIQWSEARKAAGFIEANDITVAVLDTGIDASHPDLKERVDGYWRAKGISDRDHCGPDRERPRDRRYLCLQVAAVQGLRRRAPLL
jgi:hypothetical protein